MISPIQSLISSGTKLWVDSIDPKVVAESRRAGVTGATSNPIIIADIIAQPGYREQIRKLKAAGRSAEDIAWQMTDQLVTAAQKVFLPVFELTRGGDGYVSFELDPLIEDPAGGLALRDKTETYLRLGRKWAENHPNRLIKVPATDAGIAALADLVAAGINVNVTLIFTQRQYEKARDAVLRGAGQRNDWDRMKNVFSVFLSRIDAYARQHLTALGTEAQGWVGIVGAKKIWRSNRDFWWQIRTPLAQEIVFASTGVKSPQEPAWKYAAALAGSDIETNPPATNAAIAASGFAFPSKIEEWPAPAVLEDIDRHVDWVRLEDDLLREGIEKFAAPQRLLLERIAALG